MSERERRIVAWLSGAGGVALSGIWGFAEGTLFFVVADVLFTRVAISQPVRALAHVAAAALGAVAGGALMFAWSSADPSAARSAVAAVPKVGEAMIAATEDRWEERGVVAMLERPLAGVPYKVHAILAPSRLGFPSFLALGLLARLERFALSWAAFVAIHLVVTRRLGERSKVPGRIHAAFWILVYAYYWLVP